MADGPHVVLAFIEGIGLACSPCILPILPFLLANSAQSTPSKSWKIILGFIVTFTIFALLSRHILIILGIDYNSIQKLAYFLLMLFGFIMLIPYLERRFAALTTPLAQKAQQLNPGQNTVGSGYFIGALLAIVWTPCAGPLLAVALLQVIQSNTNWNALFTLLAFSLGIGLPMLVIAYLGRGLTSWLALISHKAELIKRLLGATIILFSFLGLMNIQWFLYNPSANSLRPNFTNKLEKGLPVPYPAPKIEGIHQWFNSPPLSIKDLKGKVILIDFWTYSCINCLRTLPYLKHWSETYHKDLVIIGVHSPEFAFEGIADNVKNALLDLQIKYPVAMDNAYKTWNNYNNQFWPAHYLIDQKGMVVYVHFGEGEYDTTENNIRYLLSLNSQTDFSKRGTVNSLDVSPETYLGTLRATHQYSGQDELGLNYWSLKGKWSLQPEFIESKAKGDSLSLRYKAKKVFLVMSSITNNSATIKITQGTQVHFLKIQEPKLYEIISNNQLLESTLTLEVEGPGLRFFVFTFEG